jgi:hypothetical protein
LTRNTIKMESLYKKIPQLIEGKKIFITGYILKTLTDEEFIYLWENIHIDIEADKKTMVYIEKRRDGLGLIKKLPEGEI